MKVITSRENRLFRDLSRLSLRKYRDRMGKFLAEGPNIVSEALESDGVTVDNVFARSGSGYETFTDDTIVLSEELFDSVSETMASQGVIAVIDKPDRGRPEEALERAAQAGNVLVLDRLQDPGNIGTVIRTAEGAGMSACVFIKGTCDPFSPKVVRACAGSILRMPLIFFDSAGSFIEEAERSGLVTAVTDVVNGRPYYDAGLSGGPHVALVIGNEGNGVSEIFRSEADILLNIPMKGKLESLNAGIAAALLMYELARPCR
ncbi:MAG: RNA methyltransferase [Eubacterium sp.]|nr:RNA methyltransferase [Eubacterium sp.]